MILLAILVYMRVCMFHTYFKFVHSVIYFILCGGRVYLTTGAELTSGARVVVAELTCGGRVEVAELTCLGAELTTGAELTMNLNINRL